MDRRAVLRGMISGAALPFVGSLLPKELVAWGREVHESLAVAQSGGRALDAERLRTLTTACERIIPADETPGAIDAGVPAFIERMLADWYDEPDRVRVVTGLRELASAASARHGQTFADCTPVQQDALLVELDRQGAKSWFATVKYLTIWGYYTSRVGIERELQTTQPGRYDGCAPYEPPKRAGRSSLGRGGAA